MTLTEWLAADVTGAKTTATIAAAAAVLLYVAVLLFGGKPDDESKTKVAHSKAAECDHLKKFGVTDDT
jgi:hypothetical protein